MRNSDFYFPMHLNGDNRGCEAIARGTIEVLNLKKKQYIGLCTNIEVDTKLGLKNIASLIPSKHVNLLRRMSGKIDRIICQNSKESIDRDYKNRYSFFLDKMDTNDICFITGGDMFCYGDNEINYIIDKLNSRGVQIVLWGASIGRENLSAAKCDALKKIDVITTRESITQELLSEELKLDHVHLFPDPAFVLEPIKCMLPSYFTDGVIGINISNFVNEDINGNNFFSYLVCLIKYIISNTTYTVVLLPHVFWNHQDDRKVCKLICEEINRSDRVKMFDTSRLNYGQIRYVISKFDLFMGARTHAMISAYSTCVPALALGYSVKSKGIAKDLKMDKRLVIDYRDISSKNELINSFDFLENNAKSIKAELQEIIPSYKKEAYSAKSVIDSLNKY